MRFGPHRAVCTVDAARGCLEVRLSIEQSWCWPWSWQRDEEEAGPWNAVSSFRLFPHPALPYSPLHHYSSLSLSLYSPNSVSLSLFPLSFSTIFHPLPPRRNPSVPLYRHRVHSFSFIKFPRPFSLPPSLSPPLQRRCILGTGPYLLGWRHLRPTSSHQDLSSRLARRHARLTSSSWGILILFTNASFTFTQLHSEERVALLLSSFCAMFVGNSRALRLMRHFCGLRLVFQSYPPICSLFRGYLCEIPHTLWNTAEVPRVERP